MPAIRPHKTATDTEGSWDGPAEVAAAPEDEGVLRYMHAWVDPDADPDTKTAYKFPHHTAGDDTPAVIAGVNNALARLPQADIPEADRAGVEDHLRAHRKDAGLEDQAENKGKHNPIRCFEGRAKPHEPFWRLRNADETGGEPEMELFGYISEYSWWEDDITPKMFKDDLYRLGNSGPITIRMNSYGGDVIAASLMRAIIQDYPGRITVQIEGMAASAATVVAIAGDLVRIRETAYFMIHDPAAVFFLVSLNIEDLTRLTDTLKSVKEGIINAYQGKTGMSRERIGKMMTKETWMSAQEAVDNGFVDAIVQVSPKQSIQPPENVGLVNALKNYQNVPEAIRRRLAPDVQLNQPAQPEVQEAPAVAKLRAEVKILQKEQNL